MNLYEILVPTKYGDTLKPISTKHHKNWDSLIRRLAGGLTIFPPAKGQWVYEGAVYEERMIPVRVMCSEKQFERVVDITLKHYRQKAVMYFLVSDKCFIKHAE